MCFAEPRAATWRNDWRNSRNEPVRQSLHEGNLKFCAHLIYRPKIWKKTQPPTPHCKNRNGCPRACPSAVQAQVKVSAVLAGPVVNDLRAIKRQRQHSRASATRQAITLSRPLTTKAYW